MIWLHRADRVTSRVRYLRLLLLGLCLTGCGDGFPTAFPLPTPAAIAPLGTRVMTVETIHELEEIDSLSDKDAGTVAGLLFTPDLQTLLAVYTNEGRLRHWQLASGKVTKLFDVQPVGLGAVAFDATGMMLATGGGADWEDHLNNDHYVGWRVWDVNTGDVIKGTNYEVFERLGHRQFIPDIVLRPDGRYVTMISASPDLELRSLKSFFTVGVTISQTGDLFVNFSRAPEEDDFDVIALDTRGEFLVAADEMGKVAIYPYEPPKYPEKPRAVVEKAGVRGARPLALAFDASRHWLARVRGTEIIVWDLQKWNYQRQLEGSVGDLSGISASLAFDPSGTLLGVGTANGWQIWNVDKGKLLLEQTGVEVYAVTFSPDGRLFAWGDGSGVVHIWGIPDK